MKAKRVRTPSVDPRSAKRLLEELKEFRNDFATVTITRGDTTVSVTNRELSPVAPDKKEAKPVATRKRPAIELLGESPPPFEFGKEEN